MTFAGDCEAMYNVLPEIYMRKPLGTISTRAKENKHADGFPKTLKSLENYSFRYAPGHIEIPYKTNEKVMISMFRVQDLASICWSFRPNATMSRNPVLP